MLRLGVIGLDSSHGVGFAQNLASPGSLHKDAVVVACVLQGTGYKHRAPVIDSMHGNIPKHAEQMVKAGVSVVDTVAELLDQVDAVFLTSWDGRVSAYACCDYQLGLFGLPLRATSNFLRLRSGATKQWRSSGDESR